MSSHTRNNDSADARMQAGLRKGIRAYFDVDDITIGFWGSAWTGREVVTIDDAVISDKRSLRFQTDHEFSHAGIAYRLVFRVMSLANGEMEIELYREGELIDSDRLVQNRFAIDPKTGKFSLRRALIKLSPYFIVGMITGAAASYLVGLFTGG